MVLNTIVAPQSGLQHRFATSRIVEFAPSFHTRSFFLRSTQRFVAMAVIQPVPSSSVPSKSAISTVLSFRQAPYTLRAIKTVAFAFHSILVFILFVFQFRHVRISSSSELESESSTTAADLKSEDAAEKEGEPFQSAVASVRSKGSDVRSRRALAYKVRSTKNIDEFTSRWHTHLFVNSRRQTLFTQSWIPAASKEMKGLVVLLHGLNEHSGRYIHFARQLNSQGYGVFAMDWIVPALAVHSSLANGAFSLQEIRFQW